ncbi:MAG: hypothetical protein DRI37_03545 [Chloroflexi bacterium]|nr:MAG: hypothetical protein DRI37_03545 [Chloroflexota bacterium]
MQKVLLSLLVLTSLLAWSGPVTATEAPQVERAVEWLLTNQQDDGGFTSGFAEGSDLGATVEIVLAAVAAGENPTQWEPSPLDYLLTQVESGVVTDTARLSRVVLAATVLGQDPHDFGGVDPVAELLATQDAETAQFGDSLYAHAYALLALHNAGADIPQSAVDLRLAQQMDAGSWAMLGGSEEGSADTNTTALAVQALVAVGESDAACAALPYFHAMQNEDGGFPWQKPSDYGTDTDANSTAVVLQALYALGESLDDWSPEGSSPRDALLALWDEDSGGYNWQAAMPGANVLATAQAVQAVTGMDLVTVPQLTVSAAEPEPVVAPFLPASGGPAAGPWVTLAGMALVSAALLLRRKAEATTE